MEETYFKNLRQPENSNPTWKKIIVESALPTELAFLRTMSRNLWWVWSVDARALFNEIDPLIWDTCEHNPIILLEQTSHDRFLELKSDESFVLRMIQFNKYLKERKKLRGPKIAYFSMEFGLHSSLKIYSGGLGVLAGDYLKEASDSKVDMTAIGLLYRYGYFKQVISSNGEQLAVYEPEHFSKIPIQPALDEKGDWISVEVQLLGCTDKVKQTTANACTPGTTVFIKDNLTTEHCIPATSKYYYNNEWVKLDIIVHGSKSVYHVVNGDTVLVWSKAQVGGSLLPENYPVPVGTVLEGGYIALQAEGQPIDFRDIKIMLLDDNKIANSDNKSKTQVAANQPAPSTKVIDNFDSYSNNAQLASAWKPSVKGGNTTLSLEPKIKVLGKNGLKFGYITSKSEDQVSCSASLTGKWDFTGFNGARVWFQPDGSGRKMTIQFNTSGKEGKNINDLWDFDYLPEKGDTSPRLVLIPFSRLKHNTKLVTSSDVSRTFKSDSVIETTISIGGKNDQPGSGAYYFDEFAGCKIQF